MKTCDIVNDYFDPRTSDNYVKFEPGSTIYLGYVTSILLFIAAAFCYCCTPRPASSGDSGVVRYHPHMAYEAPKARNSYPEYV